MPNQQILDYIKINKDQWLSWVDTADKQASKIIHNLANDKSLATNEPMVWDILFNAGYGIAFKIPANMRGTVRLWWITKYGVDPECP